MSDIIDLVVKLLHLPPEFKSCCIFLKSILADILHHILLSLRPVKPVVPKKNTKKTLKHVHGRHRNNSGVLRPIKPPETPRAANASAGPKHEADAVIRPIWLKGASACSEPGGNEAYLVS